MDPTMILLHHAVEFRICKRLLLVLCVMVFLPKVKGLVCFSCDNEKSFDMCHRMGSLKFCQPNELACHTEVLRFKRPEGVVFAISKRCKQESACQNNQVQNPKAAWAPSQCNPRFPNSVCRCCCSGDLCNRGGLYCSLGPQCGKIPEIKRNGYTKCDLGRNRYSVCKHECMRDYTLVGPETTQCVVRGSLRWTVNTVPKCIRTNCVEELIQLANGFTRCTNGTNIGSQCEFMCNEGYALQLGWPVVSCSAGEEGEDPIWDGDLPVCSKTTCEESPERDHGVVECDNGTELNSTCALNCDKNAGYYPVGFKSAKCVIKYNTLPARWTEELGVCTKIMCDELPVPKNGFVKCTDANNYHSRCHFVCNNGYKLTGDSTRRCFSYDKEGKGRWDDNSSVTCTPKFCNPVVSPPTNGKMICTDGNQYNSVCEFECSRGFTIAGSKKTTCVNPKRRGPRGWSNPVPKCKVITCPVFKREPHRIMKCTKGNEYGSKCSFTCSKGHYLQGATSTVCVEGVDSSVGEWDNLAPFCLRKTCSEIVKVDNGKVKCDDEAYVGSECSYECNKGYKMSGNSRLVCRDTKGFGEAGWSSSPPKCERITCPNFKGGRYLVVKCINANYYGSKCSFTCMEGYDLLGATSTVCIDEDENGVGEWDNQTPSCKRIMCSAIAKIDNGKEKCSDDAYLGSVCYYQCNKGYKISGNPNRFCKDSKGIGAAEWSSLPPKCELVTCTPFKTEPNRDVRCTNDGYHGSKCLFECAEGYDLQGAVSAVCMDNDQNGVGEWDNLAPSCVRTTCSPVLKLRNRRIECTGGSNIGSVCSFECSKGYKLVGSPTRVCVESKDNTSAEWSSSPPKCEIVHCPQLEKKKYLKASCTAGTAFQSECSFSCPQEQVLYPWYSQKLVCQHNGTWSHVTPCCFQYCPPKAVMDMVLVLDSSSSITASNWVKVIDFVKSLMGAFTISPDYANFGFFRFNRFIDTRHEVYLKDFTEISELERALDDIPYNGEGTYTGRALRHALKVSLHPSNGNRPNVTDIILLITDGVSTGIDDVVEDSIKLLRQTDVKVIALFIEPIMSSFTDKAIKQLTQLTGDVKNIIRPRVGFDSLDDALAAVSEIACKRECNGQEVSLASKDELKLLLAREQYYDD